MIGRCPFCDSDNLLVIDEDYEPSGSLCYVRCVQCEACGPTFHDEDIHDAMDGAEVFWDRRAGVRELVKSVGLTNDEMAERIMRQREAKRVAQAKWRAKRKAEQ